MNNAYRALWWREFVLYRRNLISEGFLNLLLPLMFFLFFGMGFQQVIGKINGVAYFEYLIPGIVLLTVALTAYETTSWFYATNRRNQQWQEVILMGDFPNKRSLFLSQLLIGMVKSLFHGLILFVITVFLSGASLTHINIQAFLAFVLITAIQFSALGHIVGLYVKQGPLLGRLAIFLIFPLFIVSGLGWNITQYKPLFESIIHWLPTFTLIDGAQSAFLHGIIQNMALIVAFIETGVIVALAQLLTGKQDDA